MPDSNGNFTPDDYTRMWRENPEFSGDAASPRAQFDPEWASTRAAGQILSRSTGLPGLRGINANMQPTLQREAQRVQAVNPYQARIADQSRNAQLALMAQLQAQRNGPSIAGMQGQRAMGQMGQAALGSGNARAAMLGTQGAGVGIAGDTGQGRLGEIMRSQAAFGGAAGNLRGGDLRSAELQQQTGLRAQGLSDQNARAMAGIGTTLQNATRQADLENFKLYRRLGLDNKKTAMDNQKSFLETVAAILGAVT